MATAMANLPALALNWWTPAGGFARALEAASLAPLLSEASRADVGTGAGAHVWLVGVAGQSEREAARRSIRQALRIALAALLGVDDAAIDLPAAPGDAPYALVETGGIRGQGMVRRVPLAISHDEALSVAAIGLHGAVGIDVMRIADVPDWEALARDYLGPDTARTLAGLAPAQRPAALARAWSEREARLKCRGLALSEWRADEAATLADCAYRPLALPEGYVGYLATAPAGVN